MSKLQLQVDIETLGLQNGSVVLSIGLVGFFLDKVGESWSQLFTLNVPEQMERGRVIDPKTLIWWMQQSRDASIVSFAQEASEVSAMSQLRNFADAVKRSEAQYIWAKGPQFDQKILEHILDEYGIGFPWKYNQWRDVRTLNSLVGDDIRQEFVQKYLEAMGVDESEAEGDDGEIVQPTFVAHSPVDDAILQSLHVQAGCQALGIATLE